MTESYAVMEYLGNILHLHDVPEYNKVQVAGDNIKTSSYNIAELSELSDMAKTYLYNQLILSWLFGIESFTKYSWSPSDTILDSLPYDKAFKTTAPCLNYHYNGIPANPENMVLLINDKIFTRECFRIYKYLRNAKRIGIDDIYLKLRISKDTQEKVFQYSYRLKLLFDLFEVRVLNDVKAYVENNYVADKEFAKGLVDTLNKARAEEQFKSEMIVTLENYLRK